MGVPEINQMKQALIRQGVQPFKLEGLSEEQLRKMCDEKLSYSLTGYKNWGNTDGFTKQYKYNITYTLPNGEKIKVAKVADSTLPSGRKVETFVDIAGNQYFQYRASDNTVLKEDHFRKQEKMFFGQNFKFVNNKLYKTDLMGNISEIAEKQQKSAEQQRNEQALRKHLQNLPKVDKNKTVAELQKEIENIGYKGLFKPDKKIENINQSSFVGDCVLLGEMISHSNNNIGKEYIKNSFSYDKDGNIVVYFIGIDKSIVVPKSELYNPLGVTGDIDGRAMEKAVYLYIKQRQEDVENGAGPDIIETYQKCKPNRNFIDKLSSGYAYSEISGFEYGAFTYMLTGCDNREDIHKDDYKNIAYKCRKNPNGYVATIDFYNKNKKWYSPIIEQFTGYFGKGIVCNHCYGVKNFKENEIVINNPWKSSRDLSYKMNDIYKNYHVTIKAYDTDNFLQKPETVKNLYGGETIVYKRRNGNIARTIEKNQQGQLVKIQTYDNNGRVTGLQEYKNGQKAKLTYYFSIENAEYTPEDIKELESLGYTHDEAINAYTGPIETRYYFKNNKVLRGEEIYQNGEIVDIQY